MPGRPVTQGITDEDIKAYERDGVVCLRQQFPLPLCERTKDAVDRSMSSGNGVFVKSPNATGTYFSSFDMWRRDEDFRAFALDGPGGSIAKTLLRQPEVRLYYDQIFLKEPNTSSPSRWHQDLPFWPLEGNYIVSIWVALTDVTVETSGLEYVAGSHLTGTRFGFFTPWDKPEELDQRPDLPLNYSDAANRGSVRILSWDMKAGDCICHHPLVVHGAAGNSSRTQRRVAVSVRYMGKGAVYMPREGTLPVAEGGNFKAGEPLADDRRYPRL